MITNKCYMKMVILGQPFGNNSVEGNKVVLKEKIDTHAG